MSLDQFGKIAAAEIAFYTPLLLVAFFITLRHGFGRREGWVFLFTFSLIRIVGAALKVASQATSKPQIGLIIASAVLSGVGLSPLLLATQGFVTKLAQEGLPSSSILLRLTRTILIVGLVLGSVGGSMTSPGDSASTIATGRTLTRVSGIMFMVAYVVLFGLHVVLWGARDSLQRHNRKLLAGVSLVLPPLFVRLVYALFGSFSSSIDSRWSPIFGDWKIYLTMGLIMEYLVASTYVITGIMIPSEKEAKDEVQMERMPHVRTSGIL